MVKSNAVKVVREDKSFVFTNLLKDVIQEMLQIQTVDVVKKSYFAKL